LDKETNYSKQGTPLALVILFWGTH